ncbi:MAG: tetratricopeptide repeat protein [Pirellulales bacterium]|nr:tetratricopeptide repeat protein [Pirellulales bacterium]
MAMLIRATTILAALATTVQASEDVVRVRTSEGRTVTVQGQILDYTGVALRIRTDDGHERTFPAEKIESIQTEYDSRHQQADAALAAGRCEQALVLYGQALTGERRRWVRRRIVAQTVRCYTRLGRMAEAGEAFLLLARDEPGVADFALAPLAWTASTPSPELERAARTWIEMTSLPAAVLLGASHLLATERPRALAKLKELIVQSDGPAAQLAAAQVWRTEIVLVNDQKLDAWRRAIDRMPEAIRAGPYFVLGKGLARLKHDDEAALALLRVPILYPDQDRLGAEALWEAGRVLETLGRPDQAARLYRELIETHPNARHTVEARARWEQLIGEK